MDHESSMLDGLILERGCTDVQLHSAVDLVGLERQRDFDIVSNAHPVVGTELTRRGS